MARDAGPVGPGSNALQHLRRLSGRRRARTASGQFVIDGPVLVVEAIEAGVDVVAVYAEPDADAAAVRVAADAGVEIVAVAPGSLAKVTDPVTPQGVAALATQPASASDDVLGGLVVVLVGLSDPGNAATLVRVAEAAGASAVVSCADGVDLWSPKCIRAAAGATFRVPVVHAGAPDEAMARLRHAGMTLVATRLDDAVSLDDADLGGDVAILLGNEAHGLPASVGDGADLAVRIPMQGRVESLNVAMAGTVIAFEAARQRRIAGVSSWT